MFHAWRVSLLAVVTATLALAGGVGNASAAPANDTFDGATVITLPYVSGPVDTTGATVGADDAAVGTACGVTAAVAYSNSVWYAFTATADSGAKIDTSGSDYSVAGAIVTGSPSAGFTSVACFTGSTTFSISAGTTYYVDLLSSSGTGGNLQFSITTGQPATAAVTITGGTFAARSGVATVTGTGSCSPDAFAGFVSGSLTQSVGRIATISGFFDATFLCDGSVHPWSATVQNFSGGKFAGGKARVEYSYFAGCNDFGCASGSDSKTLVLKR